MNRVKFLCQLELSEVLLRHRIACVVAFGLVATSCCCEFIHFQDAFKACEVFLDVAKTYRC